MVIIQDSSYLCYILGLKICHFLNCRFSVFSLPRTKVCGFWNLRFPFIQISFHPDPDSFASRSRIQIPFHSDPDSLSSRSPFILNPYYIHKYYKYFIKSLSIPISTASQLLSLSRPSTVT